MPDLTGMLDLYRLSKDMEGNPSAAEQFRRLGPAFTEQLGESREEPGFSLPNIPGLSGLLGNSNVTRSSGTGAPMSPEEADSPHDWKGALSALGVGLVDMGNVIGNPRAQVGHGAFYDLTKQRLAESQLQQLKSRQDLWNRTHEQAQAIPPEILSMPEFSSLAQAKAALDRDLLDGKIDNEKNVSTFLTELERAKPQIEQFSMKHETETAAQRASLQAEATQKLEWDQRKKLEEAAAQGDQGAIYQLNQLKGKEMIPGKDPYTGETRYMPASEWATVYRQDKALKQDAEQHAASLASAKEIARIRESGGYGRVDPRIRAAKQDARHLASFINQAQIRFPKDESGNFVDPRTREILPPELVQDTVLADTKDDLFRIAQGLGIQVEEVGGDSGMGAFDLSGGGVGPLRSKQNRFPGEGSRQDQLVIQGRPYSIKDGLRRLHAMIASW